MVWFILIILVVAFAVVMIKLMQPGKPATPIEPAIVGPLETRRGDAVSILAMGDSFADLDFTVDQVATYFDGPDRWHEYSGVYRGERVFMEVWDDDGVHVCLTRPAGEVPWHEVGLAEADLVRLDESQDTSTVIEARGARWRFSGSQELQYSEGGEREGFYAWSFVEEEGGRELTIDGIPTR